MSSNVDSIATPLVRGVLGALSSLGIALAVAVVPALAAQVAGTDSSATALDAIIIALSVLVLGHGGGIVLDTGVITGAVTLTPFGFLLLLVLVSALAMRRVGRALHLVRDDGVLRAGALREAGSALGMYALVYAVGLGVLAGIGRSVDTAPVVTSAVVSGAMVAVIGGLAGLLWSLRREPTGAVPGVRVLDLLSAPYGVIARAGLLAVTGLLSAALLLVIVLLLVSIPSQAALFSQLEPGVVGGVVLTLIQLALLPLVVVWALAVLLGGTVGLGTSTGISLDGAETGVLPALPMLGALPEPGAFPVGIWALMVLPALPVALGAVRLVRDVAELEPRDRYTAWAAYPATVIIAVLLLTGLSTGGIGDGRLVHLGPQMSTLVLPLIGLVVVVTGAVVGVLGTGLVPWTRRLLASLRSRVERAERTERGEAGSAPSSGSVPSSDSAPSSGSATSPASAESPAPAESPASAESPAPTEPRASAESPAPAPAPAPSAEPEVDLWTLDEPAEEQVPDQPSAEERDSARRRSWLRDRTES